jgi:hypothetical protein
MDDTTKLTLTPQFEPYRGLIEFLIEDLRGLAAIANENTEYHRRNKIKNTFSSIEGFINLVKQFLLDNFENRFTPTEMCALKEVSIQINEKGDLHDKDYYPRVHENLLFTFKMVQKGIAAPHELDRRSPIWKRFLGFVKLRHKLVHPKTSTPTNVAAADVDDFGRTILWLIDNFFQVVVAAIGQYTLAGKLLRLIWTNIMFTIIVATKAPRIVAFQKLQMGNQQLLAKELRSFRRFQEVVLTSACEIKRLSEERPDKASVFDEVVDVLTKLVDPAVPKEISWKL